MVEHASRGPDDDVRPGSECLQLAFVRLAAVDRHDAEVAEARHRVKGLGHLDRELTGRSEDECLGLADRCVNAFEDRNAVGGGLAGTRLGLSNDVASGKEEADRRLLDRSRCAVAEFDNGTHQRCAEVEGKEPVGCLRFGDQLVVGHLVHLGKFDVVHRRLGHSFCRYQGLCSTLSIGGHLSSVRHRSGTASRGRLIRRHAGGPGPLTRSRQGAYSATSEITGPDWRTPKTLLGRWTRPDERTRGTEPRLRGHMDATHGNQRHTHPLATLVPANYSTWAYRPMCAGVRIRLRKCVSAHRRHDHHLDPSWDPARKHRSTWPVDAGHFDARPHPG